MLELILWHVLFAQAISYLPRVPLCTPPECSPTLNSPIALSDITMGPLAFVNSGPHYSIILTCQTAGPDPEDYYDCKLEQGHSLDEVVRFVMRKMEDQRVEHEKSLQDELKLLQRFKKVFADIQKELPHPVPQEKKNKS